MNISLFLLVIDWVGWGPTGQGNRYSIQIMEKVLNLAVSLIDFSFNLRQPIHGSQLLIKDLKCSYESKFFF